MGTPIDSIGGVSALVTCRSLFTRSFRGSLQPSEAAVIIEVLETSLPLQMDKSRVSAHKRRSRVPVTRLTAFPSAALIRQVFEVLVQEKVRAAALVS